MRPTSFAKDIILKFLQDFFSTPDLYDGKNDYLWSLDSEQSQILIADSYTEDLERPDMRPAVILRRGTVRWMNSSLDQMRNLEYRTGAKTHTDLLHADMTAECLSRNGLESELLADIVFQGLQFFAQAIRGRGAFDIDSIAIGSETLIQSDSQQELTAVPVGMRLLFQKTWKWTPTASALEKIDVILRNARDGETLQNVEVSRS